MLSISFITQLGAFHRPVWLSLGGVLQSPALVIAYERMGEQTLLTERLGITGCESRHYSLDGWVGDVVRISCRQ